MLLADAVLGSAPRWGQPSPRPAMSRGARDGRRQLHGEGPSCPKGAKPWQGRLGSSRRDAPAAGRGQDLPTSDHRQEVPKGPRLCLRTSPFRDRLLHFKANVPLLFLEFSMQNRITEGFGMEGALKTTYFQPPALGRDTSTKLL